MTPSPSPTIDSSAVQALLAQLRGLFDHGLDALAGQCARDGVLAADLLDQWQPPCYEIAFAAAELLAAQTALASATKSTPRELDLAHAFACEAAVSVTTRLQSVFADVGLDSKGLTQFACGPEMQHLRESFGSTHMLARLGRELAQAGPDLEVGAVVLDDLAAMAQDAFRRFATDVVAPMAQRIHRQDLTVPEDLLGPLRRMGVFGLSIPEEFGGSAPAGSENAIVMIAVTEALSQASLAAAGSLITRPEILARALLAGGTPAQKKHWLPQIAAGQPLCAIAITEPDFGSDVASLNLRATRTPGGWLLNGAKTWCTFAGKAGLLMVVARTGTERAQGHKGLSLILVEKPSFEGHEFNCPQPAGGLLSGRAIPTIGYRGMHSFDLSFKDFFVTDDHVIGGEQGLGKGFYFTMAGMVGGRMQTAARACGVMRAALAESISYARDRRVFGAALADLSLTQVKIARMAARLAACRQLTYAVGHMLESGQGRMEASLVKLFACRSAEALTRDALQIHGGMGYAEESAVSRYFVDARVLSIFEGAEETLALKVVARSLLEDALAKVRE